MSLRFIEFSGDMYVVVGFTYNANFNPPECYVAIPIKFFKNVYQAILSPYTITIPLQYAEEVEDKQKISTLLILYGL